MKKIFLIFFEKIPSEEFEEIPYEEIDNTKELTWKMLVPKAGESLALIFLKIILLLFLSLLIFFPLSIIFAVIFGATS